MIIIIKGLSGAGKSTAVRAIAALYDAPHAAERGADGRVLSTVHAHPTGGRPMTVLGGYGRRGGGCDAIRQADGGLDRVLAAAHRADAAGSDVLLEGNALSFDTTITLALARLSATRVLLIAPDVAASLDALRRRRRLRSTDLPAERRRLEAEAARLAAALSLLPSTVAVTVAPRPAVIRTAATWLGLPPTLTPPAPTACHTRPAPGHGAGGLAPGPTHADDAERTRLPGRRDPHLQPPDRFPARRPAPMHTH
ncbi:hypothetical protein [Mongoliimonas terrestris]|uniref:hypothetical protein n=1 Tax=Mongoliimonas terrestris TaxID=1709001 RepID=UPI0009497BFA|nr:hypothetical protein [Mongoliimonas terrestris]